MPRVYKRKTNRGSWSQENLEAAIKSLGNAEMSLRAASRTFKIPLRTLSRRLKSNNPNKGSLGPPSTLGSQLENTLSEHIKTMQRCGFAPTRRTVQTLAFNLAEKLQLKHKFSREKKQAGKDWFLSFMERNKSLSVRKAEGLSLSRALNMNKEEVENYFALLYNILECNNLMQKPANIFNVDETGLQLNNSPEKVIAAKGSKNVSSITSAEKGETISVVACCNAEGVFLPPYCIFKGTYKKLEFENGMPPGSLVSMSPKSAYITSNLFMDWIKNHFVPRKPQGKCLLILDGHASHMNDPDMLDYATQNDIEIICLPSHSTHWLQPLDRSFFKPLKTFFAQAANRWIMKNPTRKITRLQFGQLLCEAWTSATTARNGISGFRATGIYPFNPKEIPEAAYVGECNVPITDSDSNILTEKGSDTGNHKDSNNFKNLETASQDHFQAFRIRNKCEENRSKALKKVTYQEIDTSNISLKRNEPSTSKNAENINHQKLISELCPVPALPRRQVSKRKISATHVTNTDYIEKKRKLATAKEKREQNKKSLKTNVKQTRVRKIQYADTSDSEGWAEYDENECFVCYEKFDEKTFTTDWIQCSVCTRWLHENCTKHAGEYKCDICAKKSAKSQIYG